IFLGGVIAKIVSGVLDRNGASAERRGEVERNGLLAAAGFITGEALLGVLLAIPVVAHFDITLFGGELEHFPYPSIAFVLIVMFLLYRLALRKDEKST